MPCLRLSKLRCQRWSAPSASRHQASIEDWAAAISFARTRDDVDGSRIVLWGTSFSGGHVITTAARHTGITAVIAQCPFTDGMTSVLAMHRTTALKVGARAVIDLAAAKLGKDPALM